MKYDLKDIFEYIVVFVSEYAKRHNISEIEAFRYIRNFDGLKHIIEFYDVLHTFSFEDAMNDVDIISQRNGGRL